MQELKCDQCGQSFKSPRELQEHDERIHGGSKMGGIPIPMNPPRDGEPRR